jgi:hypothetical protein
MIGAMEKGIEAAKFSQAPQDSLEGINLKVLPQYLCYKVMLKKEKVLLQNLIILLLGAFSLYFFVSRYEVAGLYTKLREKEYILAPGVVDFTTATPSSVTDEYVENAVMSFLSSLGNINPINIDGQYQDLTKYMNHDLKVRFDLETSEWIETVKLENISEIIRITDKEIVSNESGHYKVVAIAERERYASNEYLGKTDEIIEMVLKLVPPKQDKRWFLQITNLTRSEANSFRARSIKKKEKTK